MKIDENGVLSEIDIEDVVDGVLTIPEGVKHIDWANSDFKYYSGYFPVKSATTEIVLPDSLIKICSSAFFDFKNLQKISIPDSVTEIGKETFKNCANLKHISLSRNLEYIPEYCFYGCKSLEALIIPDSVKNVGNNLFKECDSLEYIYLSKNLIDFYGGSVTELDNNYAEVYKKIKEVVMPKNSNCVYRNTTWTSEMIRAEKVIVPDNAKFINTHLESNFVFRTEDSIKYYNKNRESISPHYVSNPINENNPTGKRKINMLDVAQKKRNSLTSITITDTDIIDEFAFAECENLEEVIIGKGVKSISRGAFAFCPKLQRVVLPKQLEFIGSDAFRECTSLTDIEINSDLRRIGDRAFYNCESLLQVNMNKSVKEIGEEAFVGCENLLHVTMPKDLKKIGDCAFKDCTKLLSISIPDGVETIGESAFENCCSAPNYTEIPVAVKNTNDNNTKKDIVEDTKNVLEDVSDTQKNNKTSIEWKKIKLTDFPVIVNIPESVKEIKKNAFSGCKNIVYVHMDENCKLEHIPENTFSGCEKMELLDLPNNLKTIGDYAFSDCNSLTNITLPKGFEEIGSQSFSNCNNLRLVLKNNEVKHKSDSFLNSNYVKEANIDDLTINSKKIDGKDYEVISAPKQKTISIASWKKALKFKSAERER